MDNLQVRWMTDEDELDLADLTSAVYGLSPGVEQQQRRNWLYQQNPYAAIRPELLVGQGGQRIVGQTGGISVPLFMDGIPQRAAWGSDTMVHPDWRGRGIAGRLITEWSQRCEHSLCLGLGPTEANRQVLARMGHRPLGQIRGYYLAGGAFHCAESESTVVAPLDVSDLRIATLWQNVLPHYRALVKRDQQWLNWRFRAVKQPSYSLFGATRGGELVGYSVLRVTPRRGSTTLLVDWLAHPEDTETLDALIVHCYRFHQQHGTSGVFAYSSERRLTARLTRSGFRSPTDFSDELLVWGSAAQGLPDVSEWHLTLGDSDKDRPP